MNVKCFGKKLQELSEKGLIWPIAVEGGGFGEKERLPRAADK